MKLMLQKHVSSLVGLTVLIFASAAAPATRELRPLDAPLNERILDHILDYAGVKNDVFPKINQNMVSQDIILGNQFPTGRNEHWHSLNIYIGDMELDDIALKLETLVEYMQSTDPKMGCYNHVREIRFHVEPGRLPVIALIKMAFVVADLHPLLDTLRLDSPIRAKIRIELVSISRKRYMSHVLPPTGPGASFDWLKSDSFGNANNIVHSPRRAIKISIIDRVRDNRVNQCDFGSSHGLRMLNIHGPMQAISLPTSLEKLSINSCSIMLSMISELLTKLVHLRRLSFSGQIMAEDAQAITNLLNIPSLRVLSLTALAVSAVLTIGHVVSNLEKMQLGKVYFSNESALDENSFRNLQIISRKHPHSYEPLGTLEILGLDVRRVAWPDLARLLRIMSFTRIPENSEVIEMKAYIRNMEEYTELSGIISRLTHLQRAVIIVQDSALVYEIVLNFASENLRTVLVDTCEQGNSLSLVVITPRKLPKLIVNGVSRLVHSPVEFLILEYCRNIQIYTLSEQPLFLAIYDCEIDWTLAANAGAHACDDELPRQSELGPASVHSLNADKTYPIINSPNMNQYSIDQYLGTSVEVMLVKEYLRRTSKSLPSYRGIRFYKITKMFLAFPKDWDIYLYSNVAKVSFSSNDQFQLETVPVDGIVSCWRRSDWLLLMIGDKIFEAVHYIYLYPRE